jgi:acetyl esterase/lipase
MNITFASSLLSLTLLTSLTAQPVKETTIPLWPDAVPGALGTAAADIPSLTVYLPKTESSASNKTSSPALVVLASGGYAKPPGERGEDYGRWIAEQGIAAFVVKYRLGSNGYRHPTMLHDAARAMRLVRSRAEEWGVDPQRVGVLGFSAGGHLASTLLTKFDAGRPNDPDPIERQSSRPDLGILGYAVITMGPGTHLGSRNQLLGRDPSPDLIEALSSEKHVTEQTPPCFIWHTWEDIGVPLENSTAFAEALRAKSVRFELHIYEKGGHGVGLGNHGSNRNPHRWTTDCLAWLRENKFIP